MPVPDHDTSTALVPPILLTFLIYPDVLLIFTAAGLTFLRSRITFTKIS